MHRSKLAGFIIDCQTGDLTQAADFWGGALGMPVRDLPPGEETYKKLEDLQHGLHIEVQTVSHPSRVHLDIETDDIDAEVRRLEKLGAKRDPIRSHLVGPGGPDRPAILRGIGQFDLTSPQKPANGPKCCFVTNWRQV